MLNECNCVVYFLPKSEQSQDSVAGMSDSSSLQDVFMDPTSSQDSSHKVDTGKCSIFPEESNAIEKEKRATVEDNLGNDPSSSKHIQYILVQVLRVITVFIVYVGANPEIHTWL